LKKKGSTENNCYFLRISDEILNKNSSLPYIEIISEFCNLGTICDFSVLKSDYNSQIMVASSFKDRSLNIFQKGTSLSLKN